MEFFEKLLLKCMKYIKINIYLFIFKIQHINLCIFYFIKHNGFRSKIIFFQFYKIKLKKLNYLWYEIKGF